MPKRILFPVAGPSSYSNDWGGPREPAATGGTGRHQGTDIFADRGTPVIAVEDGTITKIGPSAIGGNRIWLNGRWYYAHLDHFANGIAKGVRVRAGQVIGYVGNTGDAASTPTHLHFGYSPDDSQGGSWANPYPILQQSAMPADQPPATTTETPPAPAAPAQATAPQAAGTAATLPAPASLDLSLPPAPLPQVQPGVVQPTVLPPGSSFLPAPSRFDAGETWQMIATQPYASPDSLSWARMMGGGQFGGTDQGSG